MTETIDEVMKAEDFQLDGGDDPGDDDSDTFFGFEENSQLIEKARQHVEDAIDLIDEVEKRDYLEAKMRAPHLVETESDAVRFLRVEKFNPWAAARRLVTYWQKRKLIFGERAYLALNFSGNGALVEDDSAFCERGAIVLLPGDANNRSVLYADRSKVDPNMEKSVMRCMFLFFNALSENPLSQTEGFVWLFNISDEAGRAFNKANASAAKELIGKAFPLKLAGVHFLCHDSDESSFSDYSNKDDRPPPFLSSAMKRIGKFFTTNSRIHVAKSASELLNELSSYGLDDSRLPDDIGGAWTAKNISLWKKKYEVVSQRGEVEHTPVVPDASITALVRQTLASYSAQLQKSVARSTPKNKKKTKTTGKEPTTQASTDVDDIADLKGIDLTVYKEPGQLAATEEEKEMILRDIFGTGDSSNKIPAGSLDEDAFYAKIGQSIAKMSDDEKAAYIEAKHKVPRLVEIESDPIRYLGAENMDINDAAQRLVLYWTIRKKLFGKRAFMPMSLCNKGALSAEDRAVLRSGLVMLLPPDAEGRPVVVYDKSKVRSHDLHNYQRRHRCLFYALSVAAEMECTRSCGLIIMVLYYDSLPPELTSPQEVQGALNLLRSRVHAVNMKTCHVVQMGQGGQAASVFVPLAVQKISQWQYLNYRTLVHVKESEAGILADLQQYGMKEECLPPPLGGSWSNDDFDKFLEERTKIEQDLYEDDFDASVDRATLDLKPSSAPNKGKRKDDSNSADMEDEQERKAKKRKMDAIYARRKRERQRIEIEVLQEQCNNYREKNAHLDGDNKRLAELIIAAEAEVELYEQSRLGTRSHTPDRSTVGAVSGTSVNRHRQVAIQRNVPFATTDLPRSVLPGEGSISSSLGTGDASSEIRLRGGIGSQGQMTYPQHSMQSGFQAQQGWIATNVIPYYPGVYMTATSVRKESEENSESSNELHG